MEYIKPRSMADLMSIMRESIRSNAYLVISDNIEKGMGTYGPLTASAIVIAVMAQYHDRLTVYIQEEGDMLMLLRALLVRQANELLADVLADVIQKKGYRP